MESIETNSTNKEKQFEHIKNKNILLSALRKNVILFVLGSNLFVLPAIYKLNEYRDAKNEEHLESEESKRFESFKKGGVEKKNSIKIDISTIEYRDGKISPGHLRELLIDTYPLIWADSVSSISFDNKDLGADAKYGQKLNDTGHFVGYCKKDSFDEKSKIVFTGSPENRDINETINAILTHELGHAYLGSLIHSEAELNSKIIMRLMEDDRYVSSYVESIINVDTSLEKRLKAQEYWAEIVKQFFNDASKLNIKDFQIVANEIKKTDPNFNWQEAKKKREEILLKIKQDQVKNPIVIKELATEDKVENGKFNIFIKFNYQGRVFKAKLNANEKFAGIKGRIFLRSDGFVYNRTIGFGDSEENLSFFFEPLSNLRFEILKTSNMEKLTEIDAIS